MMTPEQITAFKAGSTTSPADMNFLLIGLFCAALLLWNAWVYLRTYRAFAAGAITLRQLGNITIRTCLITTVSLWLVLS